MRENDLPIIRTNMQFLENYVDRAPLTGEAFTLDTADVHTYVVSFTTKNSMAENKLMPHLLQNNGRLYYQLLKDHYEGVGANATLITKVEKDTKSLFYKGKKTTYVVGKIQNSLNSSICHC